MRVDAHTPTRPRTHPAEKKTQRVALVLSERRAHPPRRAGPRRLRRRGKKAQPGRLQTHAAAAESSLHRAHRARRAQAAVYPVRRALHTSATNAQQVARPPPPTALAHHTPSTKSISSPLAASTCRSAFLVHTLTLSYTATPQRGYPSTKKSAVISRVVQCARPYM